MLDDGVYSSVGDIGATENISTSHVSGILRLTLLAADIVERIIDTRPTAALAQLQKPFPLQWERQRDLLAECCR